MATPGKHDIEVATDAVRADAAVWSRTAGEMDQTRIVVKGLGFDRAQAGVFQLLVNTYTYTYTDLVAAVAARCEEGADQMIHIVGTLHQVADTYDREEDRNLHALKHLY